jgi:hypothetical protein
MSELPEDAAAAYLRRPVVAEVIAEAAAVRRKIAAARAHDVPLVCRGGPLEIAAAQQVLPATSTSVLRSA